MFFSRAERVKEEDELLGSDDEGGSGMEDPETKVSKRGCFLFPNLWFEVDSDEELLLIDAVQIGSVRDIQTSRLAGGLQKGAVQTRIAGVSEGFSWRLVWDWVQTEPRESKRFAGTSPNPRIHWHQKDPQ